MSFYENDHIVNIDPRVQPGKNAGQYGVVTKVQGGYVYVKYENGSIGRSDKPEKYYKRVAPRIKQTSTMQNIVNFVRDLTLSADEQLLRKYGLKTACGTFTDTAQALILEKQTAENEAYLVEVAKKYAEAEKAEKKGE